MSDRRTAATALPLMALILGASPSAAAQDWSNLMTSRQYAGENRLAVDVEYAAGEFTLKPAAPGTLYRVHMEYNADRFTPVSSYQDGRLRLGLSGSSGVLRRGQNIAGTLSLEVSPRVETDLDLKFGAARADLELGGLRLRRVELATGASETVVRFSEPNPDRAQEIRLAVGAASLRVHQLGNANAARLKVDGGVGDVHLDFTGDWRGDLDADLNMGVGSLTVTLPRGVGVRVMRSTFLASFNPQGLTRRNDGYYSPDWGDAEHHLTLSVGAAFGAINIRWVENR